MKKRLVSLALTLALLSAATLPCLASSYSDVDDGRWSAEYIKDLVRRGLLTGYEDGTFRPSSPITMIETLAILSRFYTLGDEVRGWIYEDYRASIESGVASSLSWAYDELAVCLASGILARTELSSLDLTAMIEKEFFAVLLVRALGLEKTALSLLDAELEFDDAAEVTPACTGHIALLVSLGILTGSDGKLLPHSGVTREVAAAMLSRALGYLEGTGVELGIEAYKGMAKTEGLIYSFSGGALRVRLYNGLIREYTLSPSADVRVNGASKALTSQYNGCHVLLTLKDGVVTRVDIASDPATAWVQGLLASVVTSMPNNYIFLTGLGGGEKTKCDLTASTLISQEGAAVAYSALTTSYFITLKLSNGVATELYSYNGDREISGVVSLLDYGTTVTLKVAEDGGAVWYFPLDINKLPSITRGDTVISIDRLSVGDRIIVSVDNGAVKSIASNDTANMISGELISITTTTEATTWVIKDKEGKSWTLKLDENAGVFSGSTPILFSAISIGSTVKAAVFGDTITEVYLVSAASSSSKVSGTVLAVDSLKKVITALVSGKLIYINASQTVAIIRASTGRSLSLSGISAESVIVAYGSYSNSVNFNAVTLIVES